MFKRERENGETSRKVQCPQFNQRKKGSPGGGVRIVFRRWGTPRRMLALFGRIRGVLWAGRSLGHSQPRVLRKFLETARPTHTHVVHYSPVNFFLLSFLRSSLSHDSVTVLFVNNFFLFFHISSEDYVRSVHFTQATSKFSDFWDRPSTHGLKPKMPQYMTNRT